MGETDLAQLRETLAELRGQGLGFDEAWATAAPRSSEVLAQTQSAWRDAFEGRPPSWSAVAAVGVLADLLAEEPGGPRDRPPDRHALPTWA